VPSNLALARFGARRWLARIMVTWGIVAVLFTWVGSFEHLAILRFALGVAEAGFFPGAILFLSLWVPSRHRGKILALFYLAQPLSTVIGAPLAALLIGADGFLGLEGWRVMFLGVGAPAILVGLIAWFYLKDKPTDAKWLTPEEQQWLTAELDAERTKTEALQTVKGKHKGGFKTAFTSGRVWVLAFIYFGFIYGLYMLAFFLPTIIAGFQEIYNVEYNVFERGLITAIPYIPAAFALWFWTKDVSRAQDLAHRRSRDRRRDHHPARPVRRLPGPDHRGHRADGHGDLRGAAQLLDAAHAVPHRCGGRGRSGPDQHGRQPRRLRSPVHHGRRGRRDRRRRRQPAVLPPHGDRRLLHADLRRADGPAGPLRQEARAHRRRVRRHDRTLGTPGAVVHHGRPSPLSLELSP
jgi:hypothetical protein